MSVDITFKKDKKTIQPLSETPKEKGIFTSIYQTEFPQYFIKVFRHGKKKLNALMSVTNVQNQQSYTKIIKRAQSIYDESVFNETTVQLIQGYSSDLRTLINKNFFLTHFDIYKFIYQICFQISQLSTQSMNNFVICPSTVIQDYETNFILSNFDINLNDKDNFQEILESEEFLKLNLAPEYIKDGKRYSSQSNMWDLGMILLRILTKKKQLQIDYDRQSIGVMQTFEDSDLLNKIVAGCVQFAPEDRITPEEVMDHIQSENQQFNELALVRQVDPNINKIIVDINFQESSAEVYNKKYKNKAEPIKQEMKVLVKYLFGKKSQINNELFQKIIKQSWTDPMIHVQFQQEVLHFVEHEIKEQVSMLKVLILLHSYMHKTNKRSLIVFSKQNKNQNLLEQILQKIANSYQNHNYQIICEYANLLLLKYKLHFKYIKILENNLSIPKAVFILKWKEICKTGFLIDLFEIQQYAFTFFIDIKKMHQNFFEKNILVFSSKEFTSLMGLTVNVITLMRYVLLYAKIDEEEELKMNSVLRKFLYILENNRRAFDAFVSAREDDLEVMKYFKIRRNFLKKDKESFEFMQKAKEKLDEDYPTKFNFDIKVFLKNFLNLVCKMPEYNIYQKKITNLADAELANQGDLEQLKAEFYEQTEGINFFELNIMKILSVTPEIVQESKYYQRMKRAITRELNIDVSDLEELNQEIRSFEEEKQEEFTEQEKEKEEILIRQSDLEIVEQKKEPTNRAIQADILKDQQKKMKEQMNLLKIEREELDKQMKLLKKEKEEFEKNKSKQIIAEEVVINSEPKKEQEKSKMGKSTFEMSMINLDNLEKYILNQFSMSVEEWNIHYKDLQFKNLIGSGSTCKVYRGIYKNLDVAIKKITGIQSADKMKFMKEFKREISVLVSLPTHSSLLTLIGFSIHEDDVCLVTEYCEGGTLFDILYKKFVPFKLSYAQKLKMLIDVAKGMQFLNELKKPIIHRDLKSLNIIVDRPIEKHSLNFTAKIADFGLARTFYNISEHATKFMGTYHWMAPEIFEKDNAEPYTTKSDVYAFAIIMWETFAQQTPYHELGDYHKIVKYVFHEDGRPNIKDMQDGLDSELVKLIERNWSRDPQKRQEFRDIIPTLRKLLKKQIDDNLVQLSYKYQVLNIIKIQQIIQVFCIILNLPYRSTDKSYEFFHHINLRHIYYTLRI